MNWVQTELRPIEIYVWFLFFCQNKESRWIGTLFDFSNIIHHNLFITLLFGSKPISVLAIQTVL